MGITLNIAKKLHGADGDLNLSINIEIRSGEFITLYGPSGAGKTSVLRMLAGLMNPDDGRLEVNNEVWFDKNRKLNLKPQLRNVGMVFQEYSLFPNMTLRGNLEFALEKGQAKNIIDELLHLTELEYLQDKKPTFLSGGQKQRVALARALVRKPEILLLDEPLSALDTEMRLRLQDYILDLHRQFNLTTILISHDFAEVIKMSERVFILEGGQIRNDGDPKELLRVR